MVFYAYLKYKKTTDTFRYVLAAPSVEVLDEWWRKVSSLDLEFERLSPEWYTYNQTSVESTLTNAAQAPEFLNKIMVQLQNDSGGRGFDTFPKQHFTNHISGQTFFIRSKSDPSLFWYVEEDKSSANDHVYVSKEGRTKFCIEAKDKNLAGKVLISADQILISVASSPKMYITPGSDGVMRTGQYAHSCVSTSFGNLKSGYFLAKGIGASTAVVESDFGQEWELVA